MGPRDTRSRRQKPARRLRNMVNIGITWRGVAGFMLDDLRPGNLTRQSTLMG